MLFEISYHCNYLIAYHLCNIAIQIICYCFVAQNFVDQNFVDEHFVDQHFIDQNYVDQICKKMIQNFCSEILNFQIVYEKQIFKIWDQNFEKNQMLNR